LLREFFGEIEDVDREEEDEIDDEDFMAWLMSTSM